MNDALVSQSNHDMWENPNRLSSCPAQTLQTLAILFLRPFARPRMCARHCYSYRARRSTRIRFIHSFSFSLVITPSRRSFKRKESIIPMASHEFTAAVLRTASEVKLLQKPLHRRQGTPSFQILGTVAGVIGRPAGDGTGLPTCKGSVQGILFVAAAAANVVVHLTLHPTDIDSYPSRCDLIPARRRSLAATPWAQLHSQGRVCWSNHHFHFVERRS